MACNNINSDSRRKCFVENIIVVWLDNTPDSSLEIQAQSIKMLQQIVNDAYLFTDPDTCIDFVTSLVNEHVFLIVDDILSEQIIPNIHDIAQCDSIYILCKTSTLAKNWTENYRKIRVICTSMIDLCKRLQLDQRRIERQLIQFHTMPLLSVSPTAVDKNENKNKQNAAFMLAQLVRGIILETTDDSKQEMVTYCSAQFFNNLFELENIKEYEHEYISTKAIWWYTRNSFLYKMVNKALRVQDVDILYKMRTFIRDLHAQLCEYHDSQHSDRAKIRCLYRGQAMSKHDFNKIGANVGGLLSITNFLSTTTSRDVALVFAGESTDESVAILFEIHFDSSIGISSPFACIEKLSQFGDVEHEWLFSMGAVFRIEKIEQLVENKYYTMHITPSNDQDEELNRLSQLIQPKLQIPNPMAALGLLLIEMGKNDMAVVFYESALQFDIEPFLRSSLLVNLGKCYINLKQFERALICLRQSLNMKLQFVPSNHWTLSITYSNLGSVYNSLKQHELAFQCYEQALEIDMSSKNPDFNKIATRLLNLGTAFFDNGQQEKAREYYQRALDIMLEHLPPNHPNLAVVYNSLSTFYYTQQDYNESLEMARKSLNIRLASVPENHPSLGESYMNIALTLRHIDGKEEEALENCQKAIENNIKAFGENHPTTLRYQKILDDLFLNIDDDDQYSEDTEPE